MEQTLSIIKPDGVRRKLIGKIIARLEEHFLIEEIKLISLTKEKAEGFYFEHREKPFFRDLVNYMMSKKVVLMVLSGEDAISQYRELLGSTDPLLAKKATLRREFGLSIRENTLHGSDSISAAKREIEYFFG